MQTIQLKVDDNALGIVMTLLDNLKKDIVQDIKIIDTDTNNDKETVQILNQARGILKGRISDPSAYQRDLREEWERDIK